MSSADLELQKMIRGFRVSDLQTLLIYAGKNKVGKKTELQSKALELIKSRSAAVEMKIRELHRNRFQQTHGHSNEASEFYSPDIYPQGINEPIRGNYSLANQKSTYRPGGEIPNYVSINPQMLHSVPGLNVMPQYPVNPDVTFKDLPFYDALNVLLKPTSLVPLRGEFVQELVFYLGPQDLRELDSDTDVQVQFRIGCLESNKEQEDDIPSLFKLTVNKCIANLPNPLPSHKAGADPKMPKRPIDISNYIKRSTTEAQTVCVSWPINNKPIPYITGIYLVRKQSSAVLVKRLKDMGVRNPDHTTAMIKEKLCLDRDSEIATMSLRGSLICPLGKIKMTLPCRAITCTHLQCFDAALYIQMNEKKPKWICPVCDKPAIFKSLAIDGLFLDITRKVPSECNEVQFHENGSWTPVIPVKKIPEVSEAVVQSIKVEPPKPKKPVEVVELDSGSETEEDSWPIEPPKKKPKPVGLALLLQNTSQELSVKPYNYQSNSLKSAPTSSKPSTSPEEKRMSPQLSTNFSYLSTSSKDFESSSSAFSPQSPNPQASASTTFQETVDILNNPSSTAGQCYDFDLYSLIQQNHEDTFQYDGNSEDILDDDVIAID